jgi:hypothetical protein
MRSQTSSPENSRTDGHIETRLHHHPFATRYAIPKASCSGGEGDRCSSAHELALVTVDQGSMAFKDPNLRNAQFRVGQT